MARFMGRVLIPLALVVPVAVLFDLDLPLMVALAALVSAGDKCKCERGR
jgi:hypothetical protein